MQFDAACHEFQDLINDDDGEGNKENKFPLREGWCRMVSGEESEEDGRRNEWGSEGGRARHGRSPHLWPVKLLNPKP